MLALYSVHKIRRFEVIKILNTILCLLAIFFAIKLAEAGKKMSLAEGSNVLSNIMAIWLITTVIVIMLILIVIPLFIGVIVYMIQGKVSSRQNIKKYLRENLLLATQLSYSLFMGTIIVIVSLDEQLNDIFRIIIGIYK